MIRAPSDEGPAFRACRGQGAGLQEWPEALSKASDDEIGALWRRNRVRGARIILQNKNRRLLGSRRRRGRVTLL